jgi:hypothetical protein
MLNVELVDSCVLTRWSEASGCADGSFIGNKPIASEVRPIDPWLYRFDVISVCGGRELSLDADLSACSSSIITALVGECTPSDDPERQELNSPMLWLA